MARGAHGSPQRTMYPKRRKSQKKQEKLVAHNQQVLKKILG